MKFFALFPFITSLALSSLLLAGCKKEDANPAGQTGEVDIEFEHTVGTAPLVLDKKTYTTLAGDDFTVSTFNYYISNLKLTRTDGTQYAVPESYYLVNSAVSSSQHLALKNVPTGDYKALTFTIGVDSARNVSGAQTGALDPGNTMFWSWNSGYIFTKLEGTSPQSKSTANALMFHIGGFKSPNNTIRTVTPAFPSGVTLLVRADHSPEIHYNVDVLRMFSGPNTIRFGSLSTSMGGTTSVQVANNYAQGMFSVEHIHAN
jgi:hypothetical protein